MRKTVKVIGLGVAALALAVECAFIPSEASASPGAFYAAEQAGPVVSQGQIVDLCLGLGGKDSVYAETGRDAGVSGSCASGDIQFPVLADPEGLQFSASGTSTDVVTVGNPGTQDSNPGTAVSLALGASSNQGHPVTSWTVTGASWLSINGSGVLTGTTPGAAGTYVVTVTATDSVATVGSATFDWVVNA